jgi:hypothetical protein
VRLIAKQRRPTSAQALFDALRLEFDDQIKGRIPFSFVSNTNVAPHPTNPKVADLLPTYNKIFAVAGAGAGMTVAFDSVFRSMMDSIFLNQNQNNGVKFCIHQLGYGYIACALAAAGLFNEGLGKGIWLAGDYSFQAEWPSIKIPCSNDVETAQGTTARDFARFLTLLAKKNLFVDPADPQAKIINCDDMLGIFARGGSWLDHTWPRGAGTIWMTHAKVGEGALNAGGLVFSEGGMLHSTVGAGGDFAVIWQDVKDAGNAEFKAIADLIKQSVSTFLTP